MRLICPKWQGVNCYAFWGLLLGGAALGFAGSWWVHSPTPPWLVFEELSASYSLGSNDILLSGEYVVNRECPAPVSWYQEALATDGQIAQYGPVSGPPPLELGSHAYNDALALTKEIFPDGWRVTLIARCQSETVSSPSALVVIANE